MKLANDERPTTNELLTLPAHTFPPSAPVDEDRRPASEAELLGRVLYEFTQMAIGRFDLSTEQLTMVALATGRFVEKVQQCNYYSQEMAVEAAREELDEQRQCAAIREFTSADALVLDAVMSRKLPC